MNPPTGGQAVSAAHALRKGCLPDPFTRALYACAPYRGCGHGCRYCDGRAEKYYVEGDFERDIERRITLPDLLARELPSLRDRGIISLGSGVTDCYQPCEADVRITERCIPLFAERGWPVLVMTKSALVRRDLNAWKSVDERGGFLLFMTVTGVDEDIRRLMEPGASGYRERLETLAEFSAAGVVTGALAMPLLPRLSDDEASLRSLFGALKECGVAFIMPGGLTLRPGRQKDTYLETLRSARPELVEEYDRLYAEERPSGMPIRVASDALAARAAPLLRELGLAHNLPHRIHARLLPPHDSFRILLRDMAELYAERGISTRPLTAAADRYDAWLKEIRTQFRRRRTLPEDWLVDRFLNAAELGELDGVLKNEKLAAFAREVILAGRRLDYLTLKLTDG
jgi:DNA repair photolyase